MGNNNAFNSAFTDKKKSIRYDLRNPYKEGWLWKQSRHLKKWRKRWIVVHSHCIYTFPLKQIYENPTEIIDLRNFSYLSKEIGYEESRATNIAQQKFAHFKQKLLNNKFSSMASPHRERYHEKKQQEASHLILLSDLNADETFIFKCYSLQHQTLWIYSLQRALEYKCNLIQNVIGSEIIKYILSLYFLSYQRLSTLSTISTYFNQLFNYKNYNCQYHYHHDAIYWSKHFKSLIYSNRCHAPSISLSTKKTDNFLTYYNESKQEKENVSLQLEDMQFNEASFHLSSNDWAKFTNAERLQLKYFFIFYHEFSALNYNKRQTELSTFYIRSNHRKKKKSDEEEEICEEIMEELNRLDLKYENIRIDGYEWNDFFNDWMTYPFIKSLFVSCNIQTLCIGSDNFYDESASMMTQMANNAIDLKLENIYQGYVSHKDKYKKRFWDNGGIDWFCDILKYSFSFSSHLSTIRILSLRDSNLTDKHIKLLCNAINSKRYESSKSLTIRKLNLSHNYQVSDNVMKLLFTTIGNRLQYLEELELNDLGVTDKIASIIYEFYFNFHYNYNKIQLFSISLLGNAFSLQGFKRLNKLFENEIIDEAKFINIRKGFHIGVNGRRADVKRFGFDARLHIVVSNISIDIQRLDE